MAEATHKIAKSDIFIGIHPAHRRGDRVPVENVKEHGWGKLVVGADTKEAAEIAAELAGETPAAAPAQQTPGSGGTPAPQGLEGGGDGKPGAPVLT